MPAPSTFSAEIADTICERLSGGESLRTICDADDMPNRATVFRWLGEHQSFRDQYARAREAQAEALADEIVAIADESDGDWIETEDGPPKPNAEAVARSRLRVDARKWVAAKLKPKVYGDKVEMNHSVEVKHVEELRNARERATSGR